MRKCSFQPKMIMWALHLAVKTNCKQMNNPKFYILFTFCLTTFVGCSRSDKGKVDRQETPMASEKTRIRTSLGHLGIDGKYEIVIADEPDLVEGTAVEMLQRLLRNVQVNLNVVPESKSKGGKRIIIGREANLKLIKKLGDTGNIQISDVSPMDDGFHVKKTGNDIVITGSNPRGVLYGVYAFEDFVRTGGDNTLDLKKVPFFRKRGSGILYCSLFSPYINLQTEDFPEEKAEYLSRLGINQLTDQGVGGYLHDLVKSDIFPFERSPSDDYTRKVRAMSALCKKYGIDQYVWLSVPDIAADLEKYPKEALGMVKRPWGGDKDGLDRTMCVNSPIVQKNLRSMMKKLVREYPDVKGVQFYNMDGGSWLCTPELCERCKTICADSPSNEFTPWETQAKLITLLSEAAREENPDFDLKFWGAVHYHGERYNKMIHAAKGYGSLVSCWNGSDRSVMVPDVAEPDSTFIISQKICEERNIPFHAIFEYNNLESLPKSLPFPFHVCEALKKFKEWGVKNLTEIYGVVPEHNSINALVMKEFQWNPDQDPEKFLADLSRRQFGKTSGTLMYQAWEEMRKAFDVWNDLQFSLLDGSQHILSIGTAVPLPPPILPDNVVNSYNFMMKILTNVEPWRAEGYQKFKGKAFIEKMSLMDVHLAQAAEYAKKSIAEASDREFIDICYYEGVNGRPTCKEYAELNYSAIAVADQLCRQRINMLRAYHLSTNMEASRSAGDKAKEKMLQDQYTDLIHKDIALQEGFIEMLTEFSWKRPCLTRTSMTQQEIEDIITLTRNKIGKLEDYLTKKRDI